MDLKDAHCQARFLIRDRDGKFSALFDTILRDAGIEVVLSGVRIPRMNAIMERWVHTCRRELLDRMLIWNHRHLLHTLREFEQFYNEHRVRQGIANARPLYPLPRQSPIQNRSTASTYENATDSAASSTSTNMPRDLHGRGFRQGELRERHPGGYGPETACRRGSEAHLWGSFSPEENPRHGRPAVWAPPGTPRPEAVWRRPTASRQRRQASSGAGAAGHVSCECSSPGRLGGGKTTG
jgi:hypothetical protein